jgi:hypothetical protein
MGKRFLREAAVRGVHLPETRNRMSTRSPSAHHGRHWLAFLALLAPLPKEEAL